MTKKKGEYKEIVKAKDQKELRDPYPQYGDIVKVSKENFPSLKKKLEKLIKA